MPADFLHPLIFASGVRRRLSLFARPLAAEVALRQIRREKTGAVADSAQKARIGQVAELSDAQEYEDLVARERSVISGHADVQFSGLVTVTAADHEALETALATIKRAGGPSLPARSARYTATKCRLSSAPPCPWPGAPSDDLRPSTQGQSGTVNWGLASPESSGGEEWEPSPDAAAVPTPAAPSGTLRQCLSVTQGTAFTACAGLVAAGRLAREAQAARELEARHRKQLLASRKAELIALSARAA